MLDIRVLRKILLFYWAGWYEGQSPEEEISVLEKWLGVPLMETEEPGGEKQTQERGGRVEREAEPGNGEQEGCGVWKNTDKDTGSCGEDWAEKKDWNSLTPR